MNRLIIILCSLFLLGACAPSIRYSPTEIKEFPPKVKEHIKQGKVSLGMTPQQVRYAWGAPNAVHIKGEDSEGRFIEEWIYARLRVRGTKVVFTDNRLTGIISGLTKATLKNDYPVSDPSPQKGPDTGSGDPGEDTGSEEIERTK
jgi:hypothetical protein